jgi:hypothetical protein
MQAATSLHGPGLDPDRQLMIATDRSTPLNAAHRRRSPLNGVEGARPIARLPCQIAHCAISVQTNDGPAALPYCTSRPALCPTIAPPSRHPANRRSQIPIDRQAARHRSATPARGFLPRGFSDACRPSMRQLSSAAGIQEALTKLAARFQSRERPESVLPADRWTSRERLDFDASTRRRSNPEASRTSNPTPSG